ncbi:MAG: hypothetical protein FJ343_06235 [Sphingomonadales bacterium]|nr:hypothetical protein [Sphingomonadales bacterium]
MKPLRILRSIVDFWRKMRLDYRLILRSEGDLHAKVNILLRPWNWLVLISTFLVVGWLFFGAILVYTPLGSYLPGNNRRKWERQVVIQSQKIDSLEVYVKMCQANMSALRREILGEDSTIYQDLAKPDVGYSYGIELLDTALGRADSLLRWEVEREFALQKASKSREKGTRKPQ